MFLTMMLGLLISCLIFYISLGVWIYKDAKVHSDRPVAWTLISMLVPNLMGILIYFVVGRKKVVSKIRTKTKYVVIGSICFILLFATMAVGTLIASDRIPFVSNVSIGMVSNSIGDKWSVSFKTSGEKLERRISLTEEELGKLSLKCSAAEGTVYLLFLQGDQTKLLDITSYDGSVDLEGFEEGKIDMIFYNEKARDVKMKLSWN